MTYRRIVLATDFSDVARQAARVAARLAERPEDLVVAHATPVLSAPTMPAGSGYAGLALPGPYFAAPQPEFDRAIEEPLRRWAAEEGLASARKEVVAGAPAAAIARLARETEAELVVFGATGRSGVDRVLLGSTASALLHEVPCDALVVRGAPPPLDGPLFPRVLVGADLADEALGRRAAPRVRAMAEEGAEVLLAHVRDRTIRGRALEPRAAGVRLHELNERFYGGVARELLAEGRPADELRRLAAAEDASLLVVGDSGAGAIERLLLGSVTSSLVEKAPCSTLILKLGRER